MNQHAHRTSHSRSLRHSTYFILLVQYLEPVLLVILVFCIPWFHTGNTLPWQRVWGESTGWKSKYQFAQKIDEQQNKPIEIIVEGESADSKSAAEMGVYYDIERLYYELVPRSDYPLTRIKASFKNVNNVPVYTDEESLNNYVAGLKAKLEKQPVDARFIKTETGYSIEPQIPGQTLNEALTKTKIREAVSLAQSSVSLGLEPLYPNVTSAQLESILAKLDDLADNPDVVINVEGRDFTMSSATLLQLVNSASFERDGTIELRRDELLNHIQLSISSQVNKPAIAVTEIVQDSVLQSRAEGSVGRALDETDLALKLEQAFLRGETRILGVMTDVQPGVDVQKSYTRTAVGLQLLLQDWDEANSGEWGVVVESIEDPTLRADLNGDKQFVTASVFKLYLAEQILRRIDSGKLSTDSKTPYGMSVYQCLDNMIVISGNSCPIYFFDFIGYNTSQQEAIADGYTRTLLNNTNGDKLTTANDAAKLLKNIETSHSIGPSSREYLLGLMGRQNYRKGIPRGSAPSLVQDKIGFLYGYTHDIGIVRADKPYVLTILTNNSNMNKISELSKKIYGVMNQ